MERAFATLELRSVDDEQRIIEGVASTDSVDTYGTRFLPRGAKFSLPLPLLWFHDQKSPIGSVIHAAVEGNKIRIRAHLPKITEPGPVKDLVDRAWQNLKHGLVRGLSIGANPIKKVGNTFEAWDWRELSLVLLPSNADATVQMVRSAYLAVSGESGLGVPGRNQSNGDRKMTHQESIQALENTRAALVARQGAIAEAVQTRGETMNEEEGNEFDSIDQQVRSVDADLVRLRRLQEITRAAATPATPPVNGSAAALTTRSEPSHTRGTTVVRTQSRDEPGLGFARYVMALAACRGNRSEAAEYAANTFGRDLGEPIALMLRAAVPVGTTTTSGWASEMVQTNYLNEFLDMLRPMTLIGRIPGFLRVPFHTQIVIQTGDGNYAWVGQGAPKPVGRLTVTSINLAIAKAAGIIVISDELARSSQPSAQETVRQSMLRGMQMYLDNQLMDSTVAAVSNVSPASLTNGVTGDSPSGTTPAHARADLIELITDMLALGYPRSELVFVMSETVEFILKGGVNSSGTPNLPEFQGDRLFGIPVVSANTTALGSQIVLLHAPSIAFADDGQTVIDISREASVILDSDPASVVQEDGYAPTHTSLWQNNLTGIRAERWINWAKARSDAVHRIHTVAYV